jgi:hypothetical protein
MLKSNNFLKRIINNCGIIPSYDSKLVDEVLREVDHLCYLITKIYSDSFFPAHIENHFYKAIAYKVLVESILRNKRLLFVYHEQHLAQTTKLVWERSPSFVGSSIREDDKKLANKFNEVIILFSKDTDIDPRKNHIPTVYSYLRVLALEDVREVLVSTGKIIRMEKHTVQLLSMEDTELLLRCEKVIKL